MIRIEVTTEADVTRMVAAFTVLPVLRDCDYEVFLLPLIWPHDSAGALRAWRKDGKRGATNPGDLVALYGTCEHCRAPRDTRVTGSEDRKTIELFCTGCGLVQ